MRHDFFFDEVSEESKKEHGGGISKDPIIMGLLHQLQQGQKKIAGAAQHTGLRTFKNGVSKMTHTLNATKELKSLRAINEKNDPLDNQEKDG